MSRESDRILTERKLHELSCVIDDLTSLAQTEGGQSILRYADLHAHEGRLHDLREDLSQMQAAE